MSLGIRLRTELHPLLIGDVLISSPEAAIPLSVPSIGDIERVFPKGSGFVPSALCQKVVVLPNLALVWAGTGFAARAIISELCDLNSKAAFNLSTLNQFLSKVDRSLSEQVQIAGFVLEAAGPREFGMNSKEVQIARFGQVGIIGSGTDHAVKYLRGCGGCETTGLPRRQFPSIFAAATGLSIAGAFLSDELCTGFSLSNYFGGGYEVAVLNGNRFLKLRDATFLYWLVEADVKNSIALSLHQIAKYTYAEEFLVIRTADIVREGSGYRLIQKRRINVMSTINKRVTQFPKDNPIPAFDSEWSCNYLIAMQYAREVFCYFCRINTTSDAPIRISKDAQINIEL